MTGATTAAAIVVTGNSTGTVEIDNSGTIGPSVVTASTQAIYESGGDVTINNYVTLDGTINVANGTFTNDGTWQVAGYSGFGFSSTTGSAEAFTINNNNTIDLSGSAELLGANGLDIDNTSTIDNLSGSNTIDTAITNVGTIEVVAGALQITGSIAGTVSGGGTLQIDGGALLDLNASVTQDQGIVFAGASGELKVDGTGSVGNALSLGGTIAGLAATDELDLRTVGYGPDTTGTYVGDASGGTLTITDGTHSISMTLVGDYRDAHFAGATDNKGGTLVTLNAADDGPVFLAADKTESGSFSEFSDTTGSPASNPSPELSGLVHFTDIDLTDRPTATITSQTATWTAADSSSLSLTSDEVTAARGTHLP